MRLSSISCAVPLALATACVCSTPAPHTTTVIATTPATAPTLEAHGTLLQVSGSHLRLAQGGTQFSVETSRSTVFTLNGALSSVEDLPPGADVLTSYVLVDGQRVALRVDATSHPP